MKKIRIGIILGIILSLTWIYDTSANWHVGNFGPSSNGVTALISTPADPLQLIDAVGSGESNWISVYYIDAQDFYTWMQSGWLFYIWSGGPDHPKQYWEYCKDCKGSLGDHELKDNFATQNWETTVDYWVMWEENRRWCSYTDSIKRKCKDDLLDAPANLQVMSEVHKTMLNPLDTTFDEVRYKDPTDAIWKLFYQYNFIEQFPYGVDDYSAYHWRAYRKYNPISFYLPIVNK